jgi:dTDP-4-amino-4,6-dideoxygalactose transaminase
LPESERVRDSVILLPLHGSMTHKELDYVIDRLKAFGPGVGAGGGFGAAAARGGA